MLAPLFDVSAGAWLLLATGVAVAVQCLGIPRQAGAAWRSVAWAVTGVSVGLFAVVWGTNELSDMQGWQSQDELTAERIYVPPGLDEAPVWLFVGSSFTRAGIDPERVNSRLAEAGLDVRIMVRGAGGASRLEQWGFIKDAIAVLGRPPEAVFLEVAAPYDTLPAYGLRNPMSGRAISQFDVQGGLWLAEALLAPEEAALRGLEAPMSVAGDTIAHVLVNTLNVGLLHRLADLDTVTPRSPFVPRAEPKEDYDPIAQAKALAPRPWEIGTGPLAGPAPNPWIKSWLNDVEANLRELGVERFGFYVLPHAAVSLRRYARSFCDGQSAEGYVCLNGNTRPLLDRLDVGHWIDSTHLRAPGAAVFSDWLADRLIAAEASR